MKKPIYKRWWFWVVAVIIFTIAVGSTGNDEPTKVDTATVAETTTAPTAAAESAAPTMAETSAAPAISEPTTAPTTAPAAAEKSVPREYAAALKTAESYAESMHMSKKGIYDQLTSEYGENFPKEAAKYAIDNIVFDWKENALKTAQSYAESMNMSDSDIYDQLISEYGEKFTKEEAKYAIDNLK